MGIQNFYSKHREEQLDGLRGIAALIVMNSHFICAFFPYLNSKFFPEIFGHSNSNSYLIKFLQSPPVSIFFNGHAAVCVFFVLSGYVLAIPFHQKNLEKLYLRILSRYLRLNIPILFVTITSYFFSKLDLYKNSIVSELTGSNWMNYWYEKSSMNIIEAFRSSIYRGIIFGDDTFVPPLWTLKIEFLASIVLIFYLIITLEKKQKYTLPFFILFLIIVFKNEAIYYLLFVGGAFLNYVPNLSKFYSYFLITIAFYLISYQDGFYYQFLDNLPINLPLRNLSHGIGSLILVHFIRIGFLNKFFKSPFNLFLGRISYSSCLLHHLSLCSIVSKIYLEITPSKYQFIPLYLVYVFITCLFSSLILNKIDNYGISLSKKLSFNILNFFKIQFNLKI